MGGVKFGRVWEINNAQDYKEAIEELDSNDFVAEMSDSYAWTCSERQEVRKQRADVIRQAIEKGIIVLRKGDNGVLWFAKYY